MKGMLYSYLVLNKKYWIVAGVLFVLAIVLGLLSLMYNDPQISALLMLILPIAAPITLTEPISRDLEQNLKRRFAHYTLCSVTRREYILFYLLTELAATLVGIALGALTLMIFSIPEAPFNVMELLPLLILFIIGGNAFNFLVLPLVISLKSADKAGFLLGAILGFGILAVMIPMNIFDMLSSEMIVRLGQVDIWGVLITCGASAATYIVTYFILHAQLKKGASL